MKEGWKYKKLKEVCNIDYGTRVVRNRDAGSLYPVYGGGGATFKMDTFNREDCMVISRFGMSEQCTRFVKGKFFLNDSGLTLSMKEPCMIQPFLDWQILSMNNTIYSLGRGAAQKNLDTKSFAEVTISYPLSLGEQQTIVSRLDAAFAGIDAIKANANQQLAEAQALFNRALTEEMKPKRGWEEKTFTEVCDIITDFVAAGSFADLRKNVVYNDTPDYAQLVRTTDLKHDFENKSFVYVSEHAFDYLWRVNLNEESIVLPNVGVNCGEVYFVNPNKLPYKYNVLGPNAILVRSHKYDNLFLSYLFKGEEMQTQLRYITSSMAQPKFNKTNLKKLIVSLPSLEIQHQIVTHLDALSSNVRQLEEVQRKTMAECDALKQAILKEVFE